MTGPAVVLIGPPGSGKTTVANLLAEYLGTTARDTDHDIERTSGCSVSDIFLDHGEEEFRRREREAVAAALTQHAGVVSLGGGAPMDPVTQSELNGHTVVYLQTCVADATRRVGLGAARPLLVGSPRAQWIRLMEVRGPIYARLADLTVVTDGKTPDEVTREIAESLAGLKSETEPK